MRDSRDADTDDLAGNFLPDPKNPGRLDNAWRALTKTIESGEYKNTVENMR